MCWWMASSRLLNQTERNLSKPVNSNLIDRTTVFMIDN